MSQERKNELGNKILQQSDVENMSQNIRTEQRTQV